MTDKDTSTAAATAGISREEAQRRLEEILARKEEGNQGDDRTRRTRAALIIVLVILLLLLCGVGAFMYRLLVPSSSGGTGGADTTKTNGIIWIRSIYGYGPAPEQMFTNPNDAVTAPDGTIWVADPGHYRVLGFRGDGTYVGVVQGDEKTGVPFRVPSRIGIDPDGILYIVDKANDTLTIMDGQTKLASSTVPGIDCVAASSDIIVVGADAGFAILDKDGNVQTLVGTKGSGEEQFDVVGGVAIDSATKTIYVADTFNNRLSAWDYTGKQKWITQLGNPGNAVKLEGGSKLNTSSTTESALQMPTDVTIDGKGRPMVLDAFDFTISAFDPKTGDYIDKWGMYGDKDGQFMYPSGFDYDARKDWFTVADTQNLRAQIIRIKGTQEGGITGVRSGLSRLMSGPARALWPCLTLLPLLLLLLLFLRRRRRNEEEEETVQTVESDVAP